MSFDITILLIEQHRNHPMRRAKLLQKFMARLNLYSMHILIHTAQLILQCSVYMVILCHRYCFLL